jgi:hypothetical protein
MRFRISAVTASLFVIATMFPIAGQPQSGDESAIRSMIAAHADARQRGDGAAQAKFYADDADEWRSSARNMVVGRAQIADDSLFTHDAGLAWNKQQWLGAVSAYEGRARDVDSVVVERHGDTVETVGHIRKMFVDPKRPEQQIYFVRLYARRGAEWQFLSHRTVKELTGRVSSR